MDFSKEAAEDWYQELKDTLDGVLHEKIVTVTFVKESTGLEREMICTLRKKHLPPVVDAAKTATPRKHNPDVCVVYDLEKEEWRSFRYDSVIGFKTIDGFYEPVDVHVSKVIFTPRFS